MNNRLIFILSLIGLLALYWVLFGQWKWNKLLREAEEKEIQAEKKKTENEQNKK